MTPTGGATMTADPGTTTSSGGAETGLDTTEGPDAETGGETETDSESGTGEPVMGLEVVVVGQTDSPDFPVTAGAPEPNYRGGALDGFVARISMPTDDAPSTVGFATHVGGSDLEQVRDVALDESGAILVTGRIASPDMNTTAGVMQPRYGGGGMDAFLIRYEVDGSLGYATYVGGESYDVGYGISLDDAGAGLPERAYLVDQLPGHEGKRSAESTPGVRAIRPTSGGDFFGIKIQADGTGVVWGTFAGGGADDMGRGRNFVDSQGALWIGGRTLSPDFPTTPGALSGSRQGPSDGGVVRISADGGRGAVRDLPRRGRRYP